MRLQAIAAGVVVVSLVGCGKTMGKKYEESVAVYKTATTRLLDLQGKYFETEYPKLSKDQEVAKLRDYLQKGLDRAEEAKTKGEGDPTGWLTGTLAHWLETIPAEQGVGNTEKGREIAQDIAKTVNQAIGEIQALNMKK